MVGKLEMELELDVWVFVDLLLEMISETIRMNDLDGGGS